MKAPSNIEHLNIIRVGNIFEIQQEMHVMRSEIRRNEMSEKNFIMFLRPNEINLASTNSAKNEIRGVEQ